MSTIPNDRKYSKDHEWVLPMGKERVRVGITDHAQRQLGDVVYVELPKADDRLEAMEPFGSVESVKAVSEVYMPVAGRITAVNEALNDDPEQVNTDPYGDGWMIEIAVPDSGKLDGLLSAKEYEDYIKEEAAE
ncbi:glycine cleavage system protein GcvH [Wenjunlia tyrosinilytica]|jgi:glycine cleavage system H protein|uniref:Glycine cleavage system H protein n=1 Tax=Wenjunlia tyrosinilytica TaxID=1544741 RepID=A0A918DVL7_9ACTN|nr:glycine cleavage system protein GcvH [Wenjunlia tyrosinilytica]GGO84456.1 glycine cleavage system H protein [Wenjunlia tyrosinilytica]